MTTSTWEMNWGRVAAYCAAAALVAWGAPASAGAASGASRDAPAPMARTVLQAEMTPVADWLERAGRTYRAEIAGNLLVPRAAAAAASDRSEEPRPGLLGRLQSGIDAALAYVSYWVERVLSVAGIESQQPHPPFARAGAAPDAPKMTAEQRKAELAKKKQELDAQIDEGMKKLEAFHKAEQARKAAEAEKAAAEEAARSRAEEAMKAAEAARQAEAARKAAEEKRRAEERAEAERKAAEAEASRKAEQERSAEEARRKAERARKAEQETRRMAELRAEDERRAAAAEANASAEAEAAPAPQPEQNEKPGDTGASGEEQRSAEQPAEEARAEAREQQPAGEPAAARDTQETRHAGMAATPRRAHVATPEAASTPDASTAEAAKSRIAAPRRAHAPRKARPRSTRKKAGARSSRRHAGVCSCKKWRKKTLCKRLKRLAGH